MLKYMIQLPIVQGGKEGNQALGGSEESQRA